MVTDLKFQMLPNANCTFSRNVLHCVDKDV